MKKIGISVYPDFDSIEVIKEQLDIAKKLGYTIVFTSMQLGDLGFENTEIGLNERFTFLFEYCHKLGMEVHVDINDTMLAYLGATPNNLKPIEELHIHVLRLDGGFTDEEVSQMTNNSYSICLEENASMLQFPLKRIQAVLEHGNLKQYCACHNFFPLNETGLSSKDALKATKLFKEYGLKVGIFIGSLYSSKELNSIGRGVVTIESHRYLPSHIQAMELFAQDEYDYVLFGDSHPSYEELEKVSKVAKNDNLKDILSKNKLDYTEGSYNDLYCVELPVWLDNDLDPVIKEKLTSTVFVSRHDQPELMIRGTQSRGMVDVEVKNPMIRKEYSVTICNCLANRYCGELQIPLSDLPAVEYTNVVGQIKPYAIHLLSLIKYGKVAFVLKEE